MLYAVPSRMIHSELRDQEISQVRRPEAPPHRLPLSRSIPKLTSEQSVLQHPLEQFDIILQAKIGTDGGLDLADGMKNSRMVTSAETTADFRQ